MGWNAAVGRKGSVVQGGSGYQENGEDWSSAEGPEMREFVLDINL